jgi:hypothetical protein
LKCVLVFNWVLRKILGSKRKEMTSGWRKLHSKELCDLYSSAVIIRVIKPRMIYAGHVTYGR